MAPETILNLPMFAPKEAPGEVSEKILDSPREEKKEEAGPAVAYVENLSKAPDVIMDIPAKDSET